MPKLTNISEMKISCPYRKKDPGRFGVRQRYSCSMTYFANMAKLREHIGAQHIRRAPGSGTACQCCKETFFTQAELGDHFARERCIFKKLDPLDGISNEVLVKLTSRKSSQGRSFLDQWNKMWKMLFPDDKNEDIKPPEYEAVMEHFEISDLFLASLSQLISILDNPDPALESKIERHFLDAVHVLERRKPRR